MKVYTCGKKFLLTSSNRSRPGKSISKANFSPKTRRITVAPRPGESATSIQRGGEEFLPIYVLCHVSRSTWEHESFVANVAQKVMYEDVGITDELALLVEQGVELSRL